MNHRHLFSRVLPIAGAAAAVSLAGANVVPVRADVPVETIEVTAGASVQAVRLTRPGSYAFPLTPVPGCALLHQFGQPRSGGCIHQGEDIAAPQNTPVLAVVDGTLYRQVKVGDANASLSGNAWYLRDDATGAYFFYAHLDHFADLPVGTHVARGDVIGYVGDTGNPGPGNYHLHFEIHPNGDAYVIDPATVLQVPAPCRA